MFEIDPSTLICKYLVFHIVFEDKALLPAWKGSLLRGSIGGVLSKVCGSEKLNCARCGLWSKCAYGYLYRARSKGIVLKGISGFSKPFVLKPPLTLAKQFNPGDELVFSIVLFGDAIRFEREIIYSIILLGRRGIGRRFRRGRFRVSEIRAINPYHGFESLIYRDNVFYESKVFIKYSDLLERAEEISKYSGFTIEFLTPFRLLSRGSTILPADLGTIIKYALRRFTNILAQYIYVVPKFNVHELLKEAAKHEPYEIEYEGKIMIYRRKPEEYYTGRISFKNKLSKNIAIPLIFAELAHIGKRASYGHGWIKITPYQLNQ